MNYFIDGFNPRSYKEYWNYTIYDPLIARIPMSSLMTEDLSLSIEEYTAKQREHLREYAKYLKERYQYKKEGEWIEYPKIKPSKEVYAVVCHEKAGMLGFVALYKPMADKWVMIEGGESSITCHSWPIEVTHYFPIPDLPDEKK